MITDDARMQRRMTHGSRMWFVAAMIVVTFVADIVLKLFARTMLASGERFAYATPVGLVGFVPSHNDVLAFSLPIPNGWIWPVGWVIVLALLIALGRISNLRFEISNFQATLLAIILGAISNLLDRMLRGGVTDYLSMTSLFPAFNIADLLIIGGVLGWWATPRVRASDHRPPITDYRK